MNDRSLAPLPPMALSARARTMLVGLRLFLGAVTMMALYTFLHGLSG